MTLPNILTVVGTGGALVVAGSLMLGTSAALGLSAALPTIPTWVSFLVIGALFLAAGIVLVDRGGGKTAEKVQQVEEDLSVAGVAKNFPFVALGGGIVGGLVLAKLLGGGGGRRDVQVLVDPSAGAGAAKVSEPRVVKKPTMFDSLLEQMVPLAALAVSTAAGVGMKTLGIPEPADLIAELFGMGKPAPAKPDRPSKVGSSNGRSERRSR